MTVLATYFSNILFLSFVVGIPLYASIKKINVFDSFVVGAKEGFKISVNLIPYLIAMMVGIGMLRASGFFDLLYQALTPVLSAIGVPPELLPLALIRPFSGSAANGVMADLIQEYWGNSFIAKTAATMMG